MALTPDEKAIDNRIKDRGIDRRGDDVIARMLIAMTSKSTAFDSDIDRLINFPDAELWDLKEREGLTGQRALDEVSQKLTLLTTKRDRILDKKFLIEQEQNFRRDGKVTRSIID